MIFDLFSTSDVKVRDPGLKRYINLDEKIMVKSYGRNRERFEKSKTHVLERLANLLAVPGHRGKKHKIITRSTGKYTKCMKIVIKALKLIQEKTKENPIQVLVRAIECAAPRDEVTTIEYGGARYPQAVDCSPLRRLNLALRHLVHGAYDKSWNKKTKIHEALAEEIILASQNKPESYAIRKKTEMEKQADAAR